MGGEKSQGVSLSCAMAWLTDLQLSHWVPRTLPTHSESLQGALVSTRVPVVTSTHPVLVALILPTPM